MKTKLIPFLALLIILGSCKKEMEHQIIDPAALSQKTIGDPSLQRGGSPCEKADLVDYGGGVYKANYEGFTVTVTNLSYLLYSNGMPLSLRDGDPAFGSISVLASSGQDVMIPPTAPHSHFALSQLIWGGNNYIDSSYGSAMDSAAAQWARSMLIYNNLPLLVQQYMPVPMIATVFINDHIKSFTYGSSDIKIFTGKLIRSTTGSSTFAIACEHYPEPAPLNPLPIPDEIILHKTVTIGGASVNYYINYSTITQTILGVEAFTANCTPVAVTAFTNGTFTRISTFNWTTPDTISITTAAGTITITGTVDSAINPC